MIRHRLEGASPCIQPCQSRSLRPASDSSSFNSTARSSTSRLVQIGISLGTSVDGLQWTVDAYFLAFAILLLSAGVLSDRLGARRAFVSGFVVFSAASLACALAPSPAALTAGFPCIVIAIQPRLLPYIPLPLRPKMAVGNALGPRVARNGGARSAGGRKGPADSPRTMTRSMLHLEEHGSSETDNEAETPTLFGKLGGLFGKKHKNH